jgi:hypothetical protein
MKSKKKVNQFQEMEYNPSRRRFIKKAGIGIVAVSSYSVLSLSHFYCSDSLSPETDFIRSGGYYRYFGY